MTPQNIHDATLYKNGKVDIKPLTIFGKRSILGALLGPECASNVYNTVINVQTDISPRQQVKVNSLHLKQSIKPTIKSVRWRLQKYLCIKAISIQLPETMKSLIAKTSSGRIH